MRTVQVTGQLKGYGFVNFESPMSVSFLASPLSPSPSPDLGARMEAGADSWCASCQAQNAVKALNGKAASS